MWLEIDRAPRRMDRKSYGVTAALSLAAVVALASAGDVSAAGDSGPRARAGADRATTTEPVRVADSRGSYGYSIWHVWRDRRAQARAVSRPAFEVEQVTPPDMPSIETLETMVREVAPWPAGPRETHSHPELVSADATAAGSIAAGDASSVERIVRHLNAGGDIELVSSSDHGRPLEVSDTGAVQQIMRALSPETVERLAMAGHGMRLVLQVGSFVQRGNAEALYLKLSRRFPGAYMSLYNHRGTLFHRVRIGNFSGADQLDSVHLGLYGAGYSPLRILTAEKPDPRYASFPAR